MREPPTVTLRKDGQRYQELVKLWGDEPIPVTGYVAVPGQGPDGVENFFELDYKRLSPAKRMHVVEFIARKWGISGAEVARDMEGDHGCPIREQDVNSPAIPLAMFL